MSRPTVFTSKTLQKLEHAFALGCSDDEACIYAKISPSSLYNYQAENHEFLERKRLLRQTPILKARMELIKGFRNNPNLALRFLERTRNSEFNLHSTNTTQVEIADTVKSTFLNHPEVRAGLRAVDDKLKELKLSKPPA